ncbi:hypothetical protein, variant [Aphanomyces invadans]|uniref:CNNM transmembrane domain-containing protein n=1 Tax=Aphanomyces invadans TaxID=157072 RepID=A0A024TL18_9STRA|nr:hypothetical protein, variant [Aphanomyces invadans]ETV94733.1 hypothetical protein, variant [Aphanomyces invadans]|eukprot:XP_008876677.1 hypothetical protein, variant [Aphanomyces invadans]
MNSTALVHRGTVGETCDPTALLTVACDPHGFYFALFVSVGLVVMAGTIAGLTMGLLSLDQLNLQILETTGSDDEKTYATRLLPVVKQHHRVLVSLLLFNAIANEALPVFLARIVPDTYAVVISVSCVLFFGEILPSAIFTGKAQLTIAATLVPIVRLLMWMALPVAWPIAKALDCVLGDDHHVSRYKRKELKALVALHHRKSLKQLENDTTKPQHGAAAKAQSLPLLGKMLYDATTPLLVDHEPTLPATAPPLPTDDGQTVMTQRPSMTSTTLLNDEVAIIHGAMDMSTKTVQMIMTPFDNVFMLDVEEKLNDAVMVRILASGYSRIPVYKGHRTNVGLLLVKRLIVLNPAEEKPLKHLMLRRPIVIAPDHSCYSILNVFQEGRSHMALVTAQTDVVSACWQSNSDIDPSAVEILGVVTIEDVLEEIIMEEIIDESDAPGRPPTKTVLARERGVQRAVDKFKGYLANTRQGKGSNEATRGAIETSPVHVVIDD